MFRPDTDQAVRIAFHSVKGCFSIRDEKYRKIIGYTDRIVLCNVRFFVSQAGRKRVLRDREKHVHAFVIGFFQIDLQDQISVTGGYEEAYYNPYRTPTFINRRTNVPLERADLAICEKKRVFFR